MLDERPELSSGAKEWLANYTPAPAPNEVGALIQQAQAANVSIDIARARGGRAADFYEVARRHVMPHARRVT